MAEIEHFVNPNKKSHPKFESVANKTMVLFDQTTQLGTGRPLVMTMGEAVEKGTVNNETLGYFMARTQLFMEKIGINPARLRFRQHLQTEMAHYAADCWDCEIHTSYGWVECVGHADRACYDLMVHAEATGTSMEASERLPEPVEIDVVTVEPNRKLVGKTFKKDQKTVLAALEKVSKDEDALGHFEKTMEAAGSVELEGFTVTKDMVSFKKEKKMKHEEKFLPSVIEPSFGMGRILYALLEHSFYVPEDNKEAVVMRFSPNVAPVKCAVFNLQSNGDFMPVVRQIAASLTAAGMSNKTDTSGQSIGKRYARTDEVGTPYGVTVDFDTLKDSTVTLRERDSQSQLRVPIADVPALITGLVKGWTTWNDAGAKYPAVERQA
mmetsp:Transcript_17693/g.46246  ORF Transcript_17693/g.46246 Transcript_17693/m.46246 type:complete len:380 (-) Transcript_17693:351-1490(-)